MRFQRCRELFGDDFNKIANAKVIILGVGGVGSYVLDCLYRSGVQNITIVDFDRFDITNQNRQIGSEFLGELKTDVFKRFYPSITTIDKKMDTKWVDGFDFDAYDLVIDCADTTPVKIALAKKCYKKLIMSVGSAKRYDATKVEVATIWKTHGDALARKIRNELKKARFNKNFTVVFSPEEDRCKGSGSFVGVTGVFGLTICSEAIKKILLLPL
jgi:tRNA A37 threonylcarbamoyladenosine dehydratase